MSYQKQKPFMIRKIVKVRKNHECAMCSNPIEKGTLALHESGYDEALGWVSTYFHVNPNNKYWCLIEYFDIMQSCYLVKEVVSQLSQINLDLLPDHIRKCISKETK